MKFIYTQTVFILYRNLFSWGIDEEKVKSWIKNCVLEGKELIVTLIGMLQFFGFYYRGMF